jgi:soluble lytic murein transglycosylase-like protein
MPASAVVAIPAALNNPNVSWLTQVKQRYLIRPPVVKSVIRIESNQMPKSAVIEGEPK